MKNFGSRFLFSLAFASVLLTAAIFYFAYEFVSSEFPDVSRLKTHYPHVKYLGKGRDPLVTLRKDRPQQWASLSEVSKVGWGAILVSEDWAFYQHPGYDVRQIKEALKEDWEDGRFSRGASTITQQVVKNVFLTRDKNLWRKVKELLLAVRLEKSVGKRKILESYLNVAEWGEGVFGIRAASHLYFSKEPSELSPREGAFLAMLLPSPKRYSQSFRDRKLTDFARGTVDSILEKMEAAQYITEDQLKAELGAPILFSASKLDQSSLIK